MSTLTQEQFLTMFNMQSKINTASKPDWQLNPPNYALAAVMELVEGLDHTPWKWWKHGELNKDRFFMEIVDAIHFVLSDCIIQSSKYEICIERLSNLFSENFICQAIDNYDQTEVQFRVLDLINQLSLNKQSHVVNSFPIFEKLFFLANLLGYTHQQVFTTYIGKNLLNHFRQENGYKEGTYIKMWDTDKEDNDFLQEFLNLNSHFEPSELIAGAKEFLAETYKTVKGNQ